MKKAFGLLFILLLVILSVVIFKTTTYKTRQLEGIGTKPRLKLNVDSNQIGRLTQAIQLRTISYDDSMEASNPVFDSFFVFLRNQYPSVFEHLEDTVINGKSLLLKWVGKNESAKPVIFYAHLDVVPVDAVTLDEWTNSPFGGEVKDGHVWGRGTLDDKGSLMALMESINALTIKGFTPERTIYFAFGSDEEIGGTQGAAKIADYLRKQGVKFEFYMDEGGMVAEGIVPNMPKPVAIIETAEKGYITLNLEINLPGGHSSRPPKESSVDVLVNALKKLHDNQEGRRTIEPVEEFLEFIGPETSMPLKAMFANKWLFKPIIMNEYEKSVEGFALLRTTEAATVIDAGIKENVVPSKVSAKVNFRVLNDEKTQDVIDRARTTIKDERVKITTGEVFEPSANSSSATYGFKLIQETSSTVFPDAIVAPFLMLGSTDSKHFQDITENTYRFFPARMNKDQLGSIHGINEKIGTNDYMETILFYTTMLQNLK